jgi:NAD(P)-dependent dehydrogenase (short-subunit alcohol dehydrogenase family)
MGWSNKVVLVAGVGSGLGTAVMNLLASEGATVVGVARSAKVLDPILAHARSHGWKVSSRIANLLDQGDVDRTVQSVLKEFGRIDAVSINIGHWLGGETLLHRMTDDEWTFAIRDNLEPIFRLARATLPHLIEQGGGSMVVVSASPAVRWAGSASYGAAKGGLADMVPRLARDYRPYGVRINAVLPGSMARGLDPTDPPPADQPVRLTDETPTSAWEVARAIVYLLSDESRWVTGSLLLVDGGFATGGVEPGPQKP